MNAPVFDAAEVARALALLHPAGHTFELRVPNARNVRYNGRADPRPGTAFGFFNSADAALAALPALEAAEWPAVYVSLNPVTPALLARASNRIKAADRKSTSTSDRDVERRTALLIDVDPVRPADISTTDEEHTAALERAVEIRGRLDGLGWPVPIVADSGNGAHLVYRLDMPAEDHGAVKDFTAALADVFDVESVHVDRTVFNAARIVKLWGTAARKGDSTPDRPHRMSKLLSVPPEWKHLRVNTEMLRETTAALRAGKPAPKTAADPARTRAGSFNVRDFIARHFPNAEERTWSSGTRWILDPCPFNADHTGTSAALMELTSGVLSFKCQHNGCTGLEWKDLREKYEPRPAKSTRAADAPDDGEEAPAEEKPDKPEAEPRDGAARKLIQLGQRNTHLFHDERETPHAAIGTDDCRRIVSVTSATFTTFLSGIFYRATGRAANSEALTSARRVLSHKAVFEGPRYPLSNRFAFHDGAAWIDLANEKQEAVKVTAEGWTVERPPILFRRFRRQAALPKPATSGDMKKLSGFLNTREHEDALLALVWPVAAMLGHVPRPVLDFHGPQGSAKTTAAKMLRLLTDPSVAPTSYLSQKDDELALCLESNAVPLFDNVTHISTRQGEILCAAVTGAGFSKRELFTDSDEILYSYQRAIIITGINVATVAPDLLDRFLLLQLNRLDRTARLSEAALWRAFDAAAPAIFAGMLDALSTAMRLYQGIAEKTETLERMADFCLWGAAIAEALGFGADAFFAAYTKNVSAQTEEVLEADPVARAVRELIAKRGAWTGTVSELLKLFRETHGDETKTDGWPKRADGLSRRIRTLEATFAEVGISVRWSREGEARTRTLFLGRTMEEKPKSSSFASGASGHGGQTDATDATDAGKGYLSAGALPFRKVLP